MCGWRRKWIRGASSENYPLGPSSTKCGGFTLAAVLFTGLGGSGWDAGAIYPDGQPPTGTASGDQSVPCRPHGGIDPFALFVGGVAPVRPRPRRLDHDSAGVLPPSIEEGLEVGRFYNSYLQTYVERDVRALIQVRDLSVFQKFLMMLAGRVGQVTNLASLSNDVGVSTTTHPQLVVGTHGLFCGV